MTARRWLVFLVLIFLVGVALNAPYVAAMAAAVMVVLGVASWWQKHSLDNVTYRRRFRYTRGFPGESITLQTEIENRKLLPLSWLRVEDQWPRPAGPEDESVLAPSHLEETGLLVNLVSLRWYEVARRQFKLLLRKRGVYKTGPAVLQSGDLFGIYQNEVEAPRQGRLTVFPKLVELPEQYFPAEDPFGDLRSRRRLFEDPNRPMGVREYHPEDGFRRVHWPATARTGQLQVKVYQPVSAQVMTIMLDVSTFERHWEGYHEGMLERLVSTAATLASRGLQEGYQVGLISNGCLSNSDQPFRILPGRSTEQLAHLLEALAGVTPLRMGSFEDFLVREAPRIPYGSVILVLTAVTTPALGETLLRLKRHERRLMLISLSPELPPEIPGIKVVYMPYHEE